MVTVTLGGHTFQIAPAVMKRYSALIGVVEIPDGTDQAQEMGRTNKYVTIEAEEISLTQINSLTALMNNGSAVNFNCPNFEPTSSYRIEQIQRSEVEGTELRGYYQATITLVRAT